MAKAFRCDITNDYMMTPKNGINLTGRTVTIPEGSILADLKVVFRNTEGVHVDLINSINTKFLRQLLTDLTPP